MLLHFFLGRLISRRVGMMRLDVLGELFSHSVAAVFDHYPVFRLYTL